ncbi:MAG TPA: hypothetical protein VN616_08815 [Puia sp.]|nr:hypothetical protein [Puia sp.]
MGSLIQLSRKAYGISIIAIGIEQLYYGAINSTFFPDILGSFGGYRWIAYTWCILFILSGAAMLLNRKAYQVALVSAGVFLALDVLAQVPYYFATGPHNLLEWSAVVQESAWGGASLIFAGSFPAYSGGGTLIRRLGKLIPLGGLFFSIMLITYGTDHFLFAGLVSEMVPGWIPAHYFWTYFAGTALIGAGVAIIFRIRLQLVAQLVALMLFLWCLIIHIPTAIRGPLGPGGLELTRVLTIIGYIGVMLLLADSARKKDKMESKPAVAATRHAAPGQAQG